MSADNYACPLNVDVERKALAKLNINAEDSQRTLAWMGGVLGQEIALSNFAAAIQDGEMLCTLLNTIQPGTVKKIHSNIARNDEGKLKPMSYSKARENVTSFMHGAKSLGVPQSSIFDTLDVVEMKNLDVIIQCLSMLGRKTGGISASSGEDPSAIQGKLANAQKGADAVPTIFASRGTSRANASPIVGGGNVSAAPTKTPEEMHPGARGGGYGLDAALADRAAEKFEGMAEEKDAIEGWMQAVLGTPVDVATSLKDGQVLCAFVNAMWPNAIGKVNQVTVKEDGEFSAPAKFKAQENVTAFIKACQAVGVPQSCVFDTLDVVESKDMNGVLQCLSALGRLSANRTDYGGPQLYAANDGSVAAQKLQAAAAQGSAEKAPTIFRN